MARQVLTANGFAGARRSVLPFHGRPARQAATPRVVAYTKPEPALADPPELLATLWRAAGAASTSYLTKAAMYGAGLRLSPRARSHAFYDALRPLMTVEVKTNCTRTPELHRARWRAGQELIAAERQV